MQLKKSVILLLAGFVLPGSACVDLTTPDPGDQVFAQMNGANMRPAPTAPTLGDEQSFAIAAFVLSGTRIEYDLFLIDVDRATSATLHIGGPAVTTAPVATLFSPSQPVTAPGTIAVVSGASLRATDLVPGVTLDSLITAIRAGYAYVQLQTVPFPNGAVRGQIHPVPGTPPPERYLAAGLSGANERPDPVATDATGQATFEFSAGTADYVLTVANITGVTAAHIHTGAADEVGPAVVTLFESAEGTGPVNGTLATGIFTQTETALSMTGLLVLMRTGGAYVNVHTLAHPGGEIRAQIVPVTVLP